MKKKIVYFLCDKGFYKLALKISPSLVEDYKTVKSWERIEKSLHEAAAKLTELQIAWQKATFEIKTDGRKIEKR